MCPNRFLVLALLLPAWVMAQTDFILPDTSGWDDTERALLRFEQARSAAISRHDTAALRQMYATEFRGVTALGFAVDRERLLDVFGREDPSTVFTIDELAVRVLGTGHDTAVLTGRLTTKKRSGEMVGQSRFLHACVLRDGRWQILFGQGTRVPQPEPTAKP
ncbi:MAG TPA: nuclear transport factor 2 family protein [Albitalea sp.]|uniref:nuclear transport factor 2 family protein n=1 Tax=Piscinibacter sp. TaxID=1903157 RepID=UPI002ED2988D